MSDTNNWWEEMRRGMPVVEKWAYFDHAAVSPLPAVTRDAITEWAEYVAENGAVDWSRWRKVVEETRRLGAELIGAERQEVAVIRNTTEGIGVVAEGLDWRAGDNVVTLDWEFPSNRYPWLNLKSRGVEVRIVETNNERLDLDRLAAACDAKTRIVSVSWVGYATGYRNDVKAIAEIAHRAGALFFLDAIQGLGVFPLDVKNAGIDFLAADGHKWMLGPEGAGLLYIRQECLNALRPIGVGWNSVRAIGDYSTRPFELKENASRYEGGSYNLAGICGLSASLKWLSEFGTAAISKRLIEVTDQLCDSLEVAGAEIASDRTDAHKSGIVSFSLAGNDPNELLKRYLAAGVVVNSRGGRVRVSPHAYTNREDIERLIAAL